MCHFSNYVFEIKKQRKSYKCKLDPGKSYIVGSYEIKAGYYTKKC